MKKFSDFLAEYLMKNKIMFAVLFVIFIIGMGIGAYSLNIISEESISEIKSGTDIYLSVSQLNNVNKNDIFVLVLRKNLPIIFFIWLSGFYIFLLPVVFIQILLKGVRLGFSVAYFSAGYGLRGAFFSAAELIIGNFLLLPLFVFYAVYVIRFSKDKIRIKNSILRKKAMLNSFFVFALMCAVCTAISSINGYILPPVFRLLGALL